jgi:23S rRNA pseudouridine955/2504/2580 synthase/23S rRNA pseudouridine1911/1915/1917 synthase
MDTISIIQETDHWIALNKAAGQLSIPDREQSQPSLKDLLQQRFGSIFTIHRLDKDTSGVIIFARNEAAHRFLSQQFEERSTEKYYLGLVQGVPTTAAGSIDAPIAEHPAKNGTMTIYKKGKPSLTDYEVLESFGIYAWLQFRIHTGRTHQIRVHAKHIGHPIVCDPLYGIDKPVLLSSFKKNYKLSQHEENERPILNRLALHAHRLQFTDPGGSVITLESPLPKDLRAVLQQLRKWKG